MENNIQVNGIPDFSTSKEIRCRDCGNIYSVPRGALSSTCETCGNITFHPGFSTESVRQAERTERELPRATLVTPLAKEYHEIAKNPNIDSAQIEEYAIQYQLEWQLWAALTENFLEPNRHLAYLSFISRNLLFDRGSERYKLHRQKLLQVREAQAEAELADAMLDRISALCEVQFQRAMATPKPTRNWLFNHDKHRYQRAVQFVWIVAGVIIAVNIILLFFMQHSG